MKTIVKVAVGVLFIVTLVVGAAAAWFFYEKLPQRSGVVDIPGLQDKVTVRYDERGVPHLRAQNDDDLYRALGYVHAQDRLFQMELLRRLAQGELAEVLGEKLLNTDKLFRTLGIRDHAKAYAARLDPQAPATRALQAYLDGVNQFQATQKPPLEFNLLRIPKRPFTPEDTIAISGYLAYSFAIAFKTEPAMTFVRDTLGPDYLRAFDTAWHPMSVLSAAHNNGRGDGLHDTDWRGLEQVAAVSRQVTELIGMPLFQGSNAWVVSGRQTASGKPLLAGDPHIAFSVPAVWYEAHLESPGFSLYGHFMALNPFALLGHNQQFGWSLTMFKNDDIDLIAQRSNPDNPSQVWHRSQWVDMSVRTEVIQVKDAAPVSLPLRRSPYGPIITDAFKDSYGDTPVAMWWAWLETENPVLDAFYELNRANTRDKARQAASKIHAPGLNLLWANTAGDIAWWAAGKIPQRPAGVNPVFLLDAAKGEAEKPGFYHFSFNPQEENPTRGYIVSANNQPLAALPVPGYYLLPDRVQQLNAALAEPVAPWDIAATKALQLDVCNGYADRILRTALPVLAGSVTDENEQAFLEPLQKWDGCYTTDSIAATLFSQFSYALVKAAMEDELGSVQLANLLGTPALDHALPLLLADADSPWWNNVDTPEQESRAVTVHKAWTDTLQHLTTLYGTTLTDWTWGKTHTLTHQHALGRGNALGLLLNTGPYPVPGGRETPNNLSHRMGPAPWQVSYGPSTRRIVDFADPEGAVGISPLGQSGVLFDRHYADQAERFVKGDYVPMHLAQGDVVAHTASTLVLRPAR